MDVPLNPDQKEKRVRALEVWSAPGLYVGAPTTGGAANMQLAVLDVDRREQRQAGDAARNEQEQLAAGHSW